MEKKFQCGDYIFEEGIHLKFYLKTKGYCSRFLMYYDAIAFELSGSIENSDILEKIKKNFKIITYQHYPKLKWMKI